MTMRAPLARYFQRIVLPSSDVTTIGQRRCVTSKEHKALADHFSTTFDCETWLGYDGSEKIMEHLKEVIEDNEQQQKVLDWLHGQSLEDKRRTSFFGPTVDIQRPNLEDLDLDQPSPWRNKLAARVPRVLIKAYLERAKLHVRTQPWLHEGVVRASKEKTDMVQLTQRWLGSDRAGYVTNQKFDLGDIVEMPPKQQPNAHGSSNVRALFANNPKLPIDAWSAPSDTHVAWGFNDLGELLASVEQLSHHDFHQQTNTISPMHFVGYEKSAYSIAKYSVLVEMMRVDDMPLDDTVNAVVEAWFSSTWSRDTYERFRQACQMILPRLTENHINGTTKDGEDSHEQQARVIEYVKDWVRSLPITADEGRRNWLLYSNVNQAHDNLTAACNLLEISDRNVLLQYFLAGDVGENTKSSGCESNSDNDRVGSLAFWGGSNIPIQDPILWGSYITTTEFTESLLYEKEACSGEKDIMECIVQRKRRQVKQLIQMIASGRIVVDLRYGDLSPSKLPMTEKLIEEVQSLDAKTMSWSNVLDHIPKHEFHNLAVKLSSADTQHYGYSMNWPVMVFGADILDHESLEERARILDDYYQRPTANKLFAHPPFRIVYEVAADSLAPKYYRYWVDYFCKSKSQQINLVNAQLYKYSPLLRCSRTIYMQWNYNSGTICL